MEPFRRSRPPIPICIRPPFRFDPCHPWRCPRRAAWLMCALSQLASIFVFGRLLLAFGFALQGDAVGVVKADREWHRRGGVCRSCHDTDRPAIRASAFEGGPVITAPLRRSSRGVRFLRNCSNFIGCPRSGIIGIAEQRTLEAKAAVWGHQPDRPLLGVERRSSGSGLQARELAIAGRTLSLRHSHSSSAQVVK